MRTPSQSPAATVPLPFWRHLIRNGISLFLCLGGYCLIAYGSLHHVRTSSQPWLDWPWLEVLPLPVLFCATLFANRGLFRSSSGFFRWRRVFAVSVLIAWLNARVILLLGNWLVGYKPY